MFSVVPSGLGTLYVIACPHCTVVELFNAVSKQQKEIEAKLEEAGGSERKKTKGNLSALVSPLSLL